jgi:4-hydroxy-2-oxoheptanedioate aldolase
MDAPTIQSMVSAADGARMPTMVRVENNEWVPIARALDAGAAGVIAPRVNSGSEARALVRAALYPPAGDRGIGPGRVTGYGANGGADYRAAANKRVLVAAQVETRAAVERLEEILQVEGLDLVFVGPMDLGSSLGMAPDSPELEDVIEDIVVRARSAGRFTGIFTTTAEQTVFWVARGVQLILLGSDLIFMARGMTTTLYATRAAAEARE